MVAVIGIGAIGGVVAARLARRGEPGLLLCSRRAQEALRVEAPDGSFQVRAPVRTSPVGLTPVDWVLLAVKSHQTAAAADWLRALCGPQTTVAILQNGVEHVERVRPFARDAALLPVVIRCSAERRADGSITQRAPALFTTPDSAAGR